ncbi:hypothetical protein EDB89DRAFT_2153083 [Lactarius sanguifluus]|nr:hypothetical protein EDB89DRAFT_2153083 [Lactarius sanguifluus]
MATAPLVQPLIGLPPDVFNGDRSYSRAFLTQFRIFTRINRRHPDVTYPHRRVKLVLSYIQGPAVDDWKRNAYHGLAAYPTGEAWWDEFVRAFTATWVADPVAPTDSPFAPRTSAPTPSILAVLSPLTPTAASTTTLANDEEDWALFAPRVTAVPTPLVTPDAPRVEKRKRDDVSDTEETLPNKHPRLATHAGPPRASLQLARQSVPLPRKYTYAPHRATSAPTTSTPRFLVPWSPPPRPPDDPVHAPSLVDPDPRPLAPDRTVVEDDNTLTGGVKTLDDSVFAPVSAQDDAGSTPHTEDSRPQTPPLTPNTTDSSLQTPPCAHLFPRHAFERPRDPDELATDRRCRGKARAPYPATSRNHTRHAQQDQPTASPAENDAVIPQRHSRHHPPWSHHDQRKDDAALTQRHLSTHPRRTKTHTQDEDHSATAAAPLTSPPQNRTATRNRDRPGRAARQHPGKPAQVKQQPDSQHPHRAEAAATTPVTNRANAAVEMFLRRYDATQTTPAPAAAPVSRAYDAVMQHLNYRLATDPDTTRITQPFALRPGPRAVLHKWKKT